MTVTLATTYQPRGEIPRLQRHYAQLQELYDAVIVSLPPTARQDDIEAIRALLGAQAWINAEWSHGRYNALRLSLETDCTHVHYADLDRLIRWVETRPDELHTTVETLQRLDCLIPGRTARAWKTHPQALYQTEKIYNRVFSDILGVEVDLGAGSKAFSRRAVEVLMANTRPGRAMGTDAEWVIVLHRAGFKIDTRLVDGLDYESADQYADQAADAKQQRQAAKAYDARAESWSSRVAVALETVEAGLDALKRDLIL